MTLLRRAHPIDLDAVRAVIGGVTDPELHLTLSEAGMVQDVRARQDRVEVVIRLTTPSCPLRDALQDLVTAAARAVPGVNRVDVTFSTMSDNERMALAEVLRATRQAQPGALGSHTKIYAIASGKGGVGKSTVTANLAASLAAAGERVGILDADVWGYSIPALYGVRRAPVAIKGVMLPVTAHHVCLMSVGFFVTENEPIVWRGPMLHKALEQFLHDVHWGTLDVLLIDLPPGTGDITISVLELLPDAQLLVVTTPQPAASTVAARVGRMAKDSRMPVAGVIENMSALVCPSCQSTHNLFGAGGGEQVAQTLEAPLLGQIPLDIELRQAGDQGVPVVLHSPDSPSAVELNRLAHTLPNARRTLVGRQLPLTVVSP